MMDTITVQYDKKSLINVIIILLLLLSWCFLAMYIGYKNPGAPLMFWVLWIVLICFVLVLIIFLVKKYHAIPYVLKANETGIDICILGGYNAHIPWQNITNFQCGISMENVPVLHGIYRMMPARVVWHQTRRPYFDIIIHDKEIVERCLAMKVNSKLKAIEYMPICFPLPEEKVKITKKQREPDQWTAHNQA